MEKAAEKPMCPSALLKALKAKSQQALKTQSELSALLLALTGSAGTSELNEDQVGSLLNVCQRLSAEVLQFLRASSE